MLIIVKVFLTESSKTVIEYSLNQYLICGETKGRVSNVFVTYFDYFFWGGGQYKLGGLRGTRGGLNPSTPGKSSTGLNMSNAN